MTGASAVAVARQAIHQHLAAVLDRREAAVHVAIQRGVAHRHLALVAGGQQHAAGLVGDRHQQQAAAAGLDVFFGGVRLAAGELLCKGLQRRGEHALDGDLAVRHAQRARLLRGIVAAHLRGVPRRHHHHLHAIRAQRIDRDRQRQRRIDAAGQAHDRRPGKRCLLT